MMWKWERIDVVGIAIIVVILFGTLYALSYQDSNDRPSEEDDYVPNDPNINFLHCTLNVNYSQIININYSNALIQLKNVNISLLNSSEINSPTNDLIYIAALMDLEYYIFSLGIHSNETTQKSWISITDWRGFPGSQLNERKEMNIAFADQVAGDCNFDVDFSRANWSINYAN